MTETTETFFSATTKHDPCKKRSVRVATTVILVASLLFALLPSTAWATEEKSGWEELSRYAVDELYHPDYLEIMEQAQALQPELTLDETNQWKAGLRSQAIVDNANREERSLTPEESELLYELALVQFGVESVDEIHEQILRAKAEKYPSPASQPVLSIDRVRESQEAVQSEGIRQQAREVAIEETETFDTEQQVQQNRSNGWNPGGFRSPGVGDYPRNGLASKGDILVTADWAYGLLPTGHAAIVYNATLNRVVESIGQGVVTGDNNWDAEGLFVGKDTCYGLRVHGTSPAQRQAVADWCYSQLGKKYNANYFDTNNYNKFYCSQLVWRGYLDLTGINLDTVLYGNAIHPPEIIDSQWTDILYRHGTYGGDNWEFIDGYMYYIAADGECLKGGWRFVNQDHEWRYFAPGGQLADIAQVSIAASGNTSYRMDVPNYSTTPDTQIIIWTSTGNSNQRWDVFTIDYVDYYIQSRHSGLYLTVRNGSYYNGAAVVQNSYSGSDSQKWHLSVNNDSTYTFSCMSNPNYKIDLPGNNTSNNTPITIYTGNGTAAQKWYFLDRW